MKNFIFILAIIMLLCGPVQSTKAQSTQDWSAPVNLSHSGAASQPRIVALPDGRLQAFWWDRFDGLVTATGNPVNDSAQYTWEPSYPVKIQTKRLTATPYIILDSAGYIHAFWLEMGEEDSGAGISTPQTPTSSLMHSQVLLGNSLWSVPNTLAESAVAFSVSSPSTGGITVAYIRVKHTDKLPAGIYITHHYGANEGWGEPSLVYTSLYYRLLRADQAQISLSDGGNITSENDHRIFLSWFDPYQQRILLSYSENSGVDWYQPQALGITEELPEYPMITTNGKTAIIWQATAKSDCTLYLQELVKDAQSSGSGEQLIQWTKPQRIFESLSVCPKDIRFIPKDKTLLWLGNEGTSRVLLALWNEDQNLWSKLTTIGFTFRDPDTENVITLNDIHITLTGGYLVAVGYDEIDNEVWFTRSTKSSLDLAFTPPSNWSNLQSISSTVEDDTNPVMAVDNHGSTHIVWSQPISLDNPVSTLFYAYEANGRLSQPVAIQSSEAGEVTRHPAVLYDPQNDVLHLVWSGGKLGSILYSRVKSTEASSPSSWFSLSNLSGLGNASWPQIGQDSAGTLYVLYLVPLNENRGVYIVRSNDGGVTWTEPILIFDAVKEKWDMLDHPTLAISPDGSIHAAWVKSSLPGMGSTMGIFYSMSRDNGQNWIQPIEIVGQGYDWPHLVGFKGQIHLLYSSSTQNKTSLYHRWVAAEQQPEYMENWTSPSIIQGWNDIALPYGVAVTGSGVASPQQSGGALHLVGSDMNSGNLRYSTWDGAQWSNPEYLDEIHTIKSGLAASAASRPQGGFLSVAWLAIPEGTGQSTPALFFTSRSIPEVNVLPVPTPMPRETIAPSAAPTIVETALPIPSETPAINKVNENTSNDTLPPLTWGIAVAALLVISVFGGRWIFNRLKSMGH